MTIEQLIQNKIYPRILDFTDVYGNVCWYFHIRSLKDYEQTLMISEDKYPDNFQSYSDCLKTAINECLIMLKDENNDK